MSNDEMSCCNCRWEALTHRQSPCARCLHGSIGHTVNQFEPKIAPAASKPTRVDIDATGRKALDLGQSWVWSAAKWESKNLRIELRQKKDGCWGVMMVEVLVAPGNFVWEE